MEAIVYTSQHNGRCLWNLCMHQWIQNANSCWILLMNWGKERKWKWSRSVVSDSATPWTVIYQAPPSVGFSRQEYWSGLPLPSPGDLPNPGTEPGSSALQADALPSEPPGKTKTHTKRIKKSLYAFIKWIKLRINSLPKEKSLGQ